MRLKIPVKTAVPITSRSLVLGKEKSVEDVGTKNLWRKAISYPITEDELVKYRMVMKNQFRVTIRKYMRTRLMSLLQK
jgi:hypothetical protein